MDEYIDELIKIQEINIACELWDLLQPYTNQTKIFRGFSRGPLN